MIALALALIASVAAAPRPWAPLREYIEAIEPSLSHGAKAAQYARIIYRTAQAYDIEPELLAAIVRQESDFQPQVLACYIVHRNNACYPTCDYGLAQINQVWVDKWHLSPEQLLNDEAFNLRTSARILRIIKRQFGDEPNWWSRYNTSGPKRVIYETKVLDLLATEP